MSLSNLALALRSTNSGTKSLIGLCANFSRALCTMVEISSGGNCAYLLARRRSTSAIMTSSLISATPTACARRQPPSTAGRSQLTHSEPPAWLTTGHSGGASDLTTINYYTIIESMIIALSQAGEEHDAERRARVHAALGDPARLSMVDRLLLADASPSELQGLLSMPSNLVAHHLRILEDAGVVRRTRSEADRRRTYLQLVPGALEAALPAAHWQAQRVVFVCSRNSARSPLAVAIWNRRSTLPAASAGTHPADAVHPGAIKAAKRSGLAMPSHAPVHIDDVIRAGDLVVAVCDNAHEELAPDPRRLHWSVPDPAGSGASKAFDQAVETLTARIDRLLPALRAG